MAWNLIQNSPDGHPTNVAAQLGAPQGAAAVSGLVTSVNSADVLLLVRTL